jgi:hypothetical protein
MCRTCDIPLFYYDKKGKGNLIKCYPFNIRVDNTNDDMKCPECKINFCIERQFKKGDAFKLI